MEVKSSVNRRPPPVMAPNQRRGPLFRTQDLSKAGIETVDFCDVPIDNVTLDRALRSICIRIAEGLPGYIVTPNIDHICRAHRNAEFRWAYGEAFLSLLDSMPMFWIGRLLGIRFKAKLSGSDMVYHIAQFARDKGFSVFLLGAAEGIADQAAAKLQERYPGLKIAGTYSPPQFFEEDPAANEEVLRRLREAKPDMCFVAFGAPRQELWMQRNCRAAHVPVMIGVGASLDFAAGKVARAPRFMQRAGLEWLWRLCREPRRLWRRYLVDDALFYPIAAKAIATHARQVLFHRPRRARRTRFPHSF